MPTPSATNPYGDLIETSLRVVTWNVWWRLGDWRRRADGIAGTLEHLAPDVVVLQEAWQAAGESQPAMLADRFQLHHVFGAEREDDGVEQGIAILSRFPFTWTKVVELPVPAAPANLVVVAEVNGPRGPFLIFGTHLAPYFHQSALRQTQVRALADTVADHQPHPYPAIVCGDFNAAPDSDEIRLMTGRTAPARPGLVFLDAWATAGDGSPGDTMSKLNTNAAPLLIPDLRWDYIFVSWPSGGGGAGHPVRAWLAGTEPIDGVYPSDHFALGADLRY